MPFVWSVGTIIGPAIGGTCANPHESFPNLFSAEGIFARFPYLLPNLLCALLLLVSIILGYFFLEETHPDMRTRIPPPVETYVSDETPLMETSDAMKRPAVDMRDETYGTFRSQDSAEESQAQWAREEKRFNTSIFSKRIMSVVIALSIFTYHSMTYDHLLPIFFEDNRAPSMALAGLSPGSLFYAPGGLGLSLQNVGMIMAVNGAIALFIQAVIFPIAAERIGVHRLFILVTVLHPISYLLVPFLLYVPQGLLYPAIYACLTVRNLFAIIVYPLLLILIKEATPSLSVLGKVNGMAASAGAACRMIAPPIAGYLYTVGSRIDCTALAWYGSAVVAVIGAFQCFSVKREKAADQHSGEEATGRKGQNGAITTILSVSEDDE